MWRIVFVAVLGFAGFSRADGLRRVLDEGERAFLSRPVAKLVDAVNAARAAKKQKPCTREGGEVEASVEMSPWGALPGAWRSIVLRCEGRKFQVKLSPEPSSPQEQELRDGSAGSRPGAMSFAPSHHIVERGDGFVVLESTFDDSRTTTLYAGEISAFPAPLPEKPPALLAVPKSVEVFDSVGGPIRDAIDVAAVLKVLRSPEAAPPAVAAAEGKGTLDEAGRKREENSVVALLLGGAVLNPAPLPQKLPGDFPEVVTKAARDVLPSVVDDFVAANREPKPFPFSAGKEGESVSMSRVGFSRDGTQAMTFVRRKSGQRFVILRRTDAGWRELYELPL